MAQIIGYRSYPSNTRATTYLRRRLPSRISWDRMSGMLQGSRTPNFYGYRASGAVPKYKPATGGYGGGGGYSGVDFNSLLEEAMRGWGEGFDMSGFELPSYEFPAINIDLPNLKWNPDEAKKASLLDEATKLAGLIYDPQVANREQALTRFKTEAEAQRGEINPRYTAMSQALANVYENTVKQEIIDAAVRRGAAGSGSESGWLREELGKAGESEVAQRRDIENTRNELLNAIGKQVSAKEVETSDALQLLGELRGKQKEVSYQDLERQAREQWLNEKQGSFQNQLQKALFESGYATDQAGYLLNRFATEKAAQMEQANYALAQRQSALQEAMSRYNVLSNANYGRVADPTYSYNMLGYDVPLSAAQLLQVYLQQLNQGQNSLFAQMLAQALGGGQIQ